MSWERHYEDQKRLKKLVEKSRTWFTGAFFNKDKERYERLDWGQTRKKELKKASSKSARRHYKNLEEIPTSKGNHLHKIFDFWWKLL